MLWVVPLGPRPLQATETTNVTRLACARSWGGAGWESKEKPLQHFQGL